MSLINLILKLLLQFVPFETNEFERLQGDADSWWKGIIYPDKSDFTDESVNSHLKKYPEQNLELMKFKSKCDLWYFRGGFAVLYIILHREIQRYMNPKEEKQSKEE